MPARGQDPAHQADRRRVLVGLVLVLAAAAATPFLIYLLFSVFDLPDGVFGGVAAAGGLIVLVGGFFLLRRYGSRVQGRHEHDFRADDAAWAAAQGWRIRTGQEVAGERFPPLVHGPAMSPEQCHQIIDGALPGRTLRIESWSMRYRAGGSPWTLGHRRYLVGVSASDHLPVVAMGHWQQVRYAEANLPPELMRQKMVRTGSIMYFANSEQGAQVVAQLGHLADHICPSEAWVAVGPGQVILAFERSPEAVPALEQRIALADSVAETLDRAWHQHGAP